MSTITAIETQKRDPDRVNIQVDGEFAFSLAGTLASGLRVGQDLGPQSLAGLRAEDARESAYQQALLFLSYRIRSEAEVREYLRKHSIPEDLLERTLVRLRQNGLSDDVKFAREWVENRNTFRPRGRRALAWELHRKGVAAETVDSALSEVDEPALAYAAGRKKARQFGLLSWPDFRNKLTAFLSRRGFPHSVIVPVASRLWNETHAGQPLSDDEVIP
jgi:regulatory protein